MDYAPKEVRYPGPEPIADPIMAGPNKLLSGLD
jgi:hypothetical protein